MNDILLQIGSLIVVATLLSIIGKYLRQPPLIAYILTGILFSYFGYFSDESKPILDIISSIGVILLLYVAGLKIKLKDFIRVSRHALFIGEGHDLIMFSVGVTIGVFLLGLTTLQSVYLALALTLSSTIVVVKVLTDRKEIAAPHGQILMGTMVLQDIVAMVSLAIFSALDSNPFVNITLTLVKGAILLFFLILVGKHVISRVFERVADHVELVFLLGLAWCFGPVLLAHYVGFSPEIAAFIAGISIAHLPFSFEIYDKARSIQDFGLLLFFFTIGATLSLNPQTFISLEFFGLTLFVLLATPIISGALSSLRGLDKKNNFMISLLPIQVSEFSIILMSIGLKLGHVTEHLFSLVVGITVVTIIFSSTFLTNISALYKKVHHRLGFLERKKVSHFRKIPKLKGHVVIFGYGTLGQRIATFFKKKPVVVVEWKPELVRLAKRHHVIYGDAGDKDVWDEAQIATASLVVSTINSNIDDDVTLGCYIRRYHPRTISVAETNVQSEVHLLKKAGYDFVIYQDDCEWQILEKFLKSKSKRLKI